MRQKVGIDYESRVAILAVLARCSVKRTVGVKHPMGVALDTTENPNKKFERFKHDRIIEARVVIAAGYIAGIMQNDPLDTLRLYTAVWSVLRGTKTESFRILMRFYKGMCRGSRKRAQLDGVGVSPELYDELITRVQPQGRA